MGRMSTMSPKPTQHHWGQPVLRFSKTFLKAILLACLLWGLITLLWHVYLLEIMILATHRAGWTLFATCASTRPTSTSPTSTTTLASWSPVTRWAGPGLRDANKPSKRFSQGHYPVVEYLLNTGADPNAKVTSNESFSLSMDSPLQIMYNCIFTRLVHSVSSPWLDFLQALCGASALHFSAEIGNVEIGENT